MGTTPLLAALSGLFLMSDPQVPPAMHVTPVEMLSGSHQRVTFTLTIGATDIERGGGMRIELPVAYLETEPYYWDRPQTHSPEGRGYVRATATGGAAVEVRLSGVHGGVVECVVERGSVHAGDRIELTYAGVVQRLTWELPVRAQWRRTDQDAWHTVDDAPVLTFLPQKATTLYAVAPADVRRGVVFDLAVVALDRFGNRASRYRGTISFGSTDPEAQVPGPYAFVADDAGVHVFKNVRYGTTGFQKFTLTDGQLDGRSNYSDVQDAEPRLQRYFGDTHFHTGTGTGNKEFTTASAGGDHRGHFTSQSAAYAYVRDVMRLDFASAAEHDSEELAQHAWEKSQMIADALYQPGRFTTFYAYEWTASPAEGHHVIMYKDREGRMLSHSEYPSKAAIYEALHRQNVPAVMIPHMMWAQPDHGIWDRVDNRLRRVGEIYSLWNNRFLLQPADEPQRFELGIADRWSFQYAWAHGHRIGVIGSTDNHTGHPGANNYTAYTQHAGGLAAVWASANTREAIWDAMQQRRTYATTGTRILLDLRADGHWMGEQYPTLAAPKFTVKVAGTNRIRSVDLVKYDGSGYSTIRSEEPASEVCVFQHSDEAFAADSMYYVRVRQVDEHHRSPWSKTTSEMAWSSPIWVTYAEPSPDQEAPESVGVTDGAKRGG